MYLFLVLLSSLECLSRVNVNMLVLLVGIFLIHTATAVLLFISTISNVWLQSMSSGSRGIWMICNNNCSNIIDFIPADDAPSMRAVQAFMILAIIFCCFSLCCFIGQLFMLVKGDRFYITGAFMMICWLCILIAVSIYTARFSKLENYYHGYCFILAWICFCLSFIVGVLYFVLRKK